MTSTAKTAVGTTGAHTVRHRRAKSRGVSALMYAAQQGNVDKVRKFIRAQPSSLFDRDRTGKSALHYCCTSDNICAAQAADLLVMAAPDLVEGRDEDGFTPLHLAVIAGNMQLVTFLLANNADVNAVDNEKHTVVHWATVCGETAALRAVLAAGAPVSTPDVHGGYPLHYAAQMCGGAANDRDSSLGMQVLQTLLSHNDIVISVTDGDKRQPLLWAASAGSAKAVLALVRAGAAVETADKDGLTALHCAASRGHTDCLDTLLTLCGASPDVIDSNGCTALHYAVTLGHADATALLLAHGADPNRQDRKGRSPAHCGCAKGQFETVKLIGSHRANLWLRNARGDLPLHEAAASGRRELVKWLLEMRPSQVNARNNDGKCPLHMAALNDNSDMCKILLDTGAQVNPILRTSKNVFMTPLDCALQRGFRSTAKFLQLHGGVPATRLNPNHPVNSALNLQIRDDVTFWGNTSSDSERENAEVTRSGKKVYRKKAAHKLERKKASLSGSDTENSRLKNGSFEKTENRTRKKPSERDSEKKSAVSDTSTAAMHSSRQSGSIKLPSSRVDYSNEIIINGKTEINIHQTKEIIIDKDSVITDRASDTIITNEAPPNQQAVSEKDRRPRSAKYSRVRDRSAKSSAERNIIKSTKDTITSPETVIEQERREKELRKQFASRQQSTNTSEETTETVIENHKMVGSKEDVDGSKADDKTLPERRKLHDQQSIMSNTSEDVDVQKEFVVEASIHAPPKSQEEQLAKENLVEADPEKATDLDEKHDKIMKQDLETHPTAADNQEEVLKENDPIKESAVVKEKETVVVDEGNASNKGQEMQNVVRVESLKETYQTDESNVHISEQDDVKKKDTTSENQGETSTKVKDLSNTEEQVLENTETEISQTVNDVKLIDAGKVSQEKNGNNESQTKAIVEQSVANKENQTVSKSVPKKDTVDLQIGQEMATKNKDIETGTPTNVDIPSQDSTKDHAEIIDSGNNQDQSEALAPKALDQNENDMNALSKNDNNINKDDGTSAPKIEDKLSKMEKENVVDETMSKSTVTQQKQETSERQRAKRSEEPRKKRNQIEGKHSKNVKEKEIYSEEEYSSPSDDSSLSTPSKSHKSFRVLDEEEAEVLHKTKSKKAKSKRSGKKGSRSRSVENKKATDTKRKETSKRSKIPTPLGKTTLSKSDRHLDKTYQADLKSQSTLDGRVPSLPNIHEGKGRIRDPPRSESNMSAPVLNSLYSDRDSLSDMEEDSISVAKMKKRVKKRSKIREAKSAGSDYESSNLIDSGFEPSPRSTRIPKWRNMSDRGVNMTTVTQTIQSNIRRYHLERKIFQHLLELKRHQIRAGQHNEAVLVKRAIDAYHQSCASTVGAGRYIPEDFTFKSFEKFLYESLRKLQKSDIEYMKGLPEAPSNPLLCTRSTNRCMHATHAYTGVPCAAYLPKVDHHTIPKIGFTTCKPGTGFLPNINTKKAVTLELSHGPDKQVISLPTDRLDQNKRYYVTFTVKGRDRSPSNEDGSSSKTAHRHSKSD